MKKKREIIVTVAAVLVVLAGTYLWVRRRCRLVKSLSSRFPAQISASSRRRSTARPASRDWSCWRLPLDHFVCGGLRGAAIVGSASRPKGASAGCFGSPS